MKKTILLLSALIAPTLALAQDGPRPISLNEAVTMAKKNAPAMISARGQIRTSAASVKVAKWAFNPLNNIVLGYGSSISGGVTYVNDVRLDRPGTAWNFSQSFGSANLTIWDGGVKLAAIRTANAQLDQAEVNETLQTFTISQSVKTQYYTILRQQELLATARLQLENAKAQMATAKAKVAQGAATVADTLQSLIAIITAENAILSTQNNIDNANAQLTRLVASEYTVTAIVSDTTDPAPFTIPEAELAGYVERAPTVRSAVSALAVSKSRERSTRAVLWPTITATGSYGRSNQQPTTGGFSGYDFGAGPMNQSWSFGLNASFTLFNGFSRESQILSAKITSDNSEASLRDARLTYRQNLTQQIGALKLADAQIALTRTQVTVAEDNLRIVQRRYELGTGVLLDLTTAQQALTTARNNLTSARFDARNARTALETLLGRDLPQ